MSHDQLCFYYRDNGEFDLIADRCPQCATIAKVRADERDKAAKQVPALFASAPFVYPTDIDAVEFAQDWLRRGGDPIDTVRGGS